GERDRSVVVDDGIARSRRAAVKGFLRRANSGLRLDRYREPLLGGTSSASPPHDDRYPDQRLYSRDCQNKQRNEFGYFPTVVHSVLRRLRRTRLSFDVEFHVVAGHLGDPHVRDVWPVWTGEAAVELDADFGLHPRGAMHVVRPESRLPGDNVDNGFRGAVRFDRLAATGQLQCRDADQRADDTPQSEAMCF